MELRTVTRDGRSIATPVGATVADGHVYIRSQRRERSMWLRRALRTPTGAIAAGDTSLPVAFALVDEPAELRRVNAATLAKYGGPLRSLLLRPALWWTRRFVVRATPAG